MLGETFSGKERNVAETKTLSERADELEHQQMRDLERVITKSALFNMADGRIGADFAPGRLLHMGDDPRLPKMPAKPTVMDFFKYRMGPSQNHLLQSAALARRNGMNEKVVLACLLHDIAVAAFIRCDHGYWGAQLVEPYVEAEVCWAIRAHQALRFYPDESVGYAYPELYTKYFGADYQPEPYIKEEYKRAREHKWYMTARMICVNDLYSFDPNAVVRLEEFEDVVGRNFKQPEEGLGFDNSSTAHMWRTMMRPTNAL
jgi:hypothetical protein